MNGILKRDNLDHPDLGFAILPEYEGHSYAFEASDAVINWVRSQKIAPILYSMTLPSNQRSINLIERLGFKPEGTTVNQGSEVLLFKLEL